MIRALNEKELFTALEVMHKSYEPIAERFGLTEENCPFRGNASLPYEILADDFHKGVFMFGCFIEDIMVGFISLKMIDNSLCKMKDIVVIPEYQRKGFGKSLLDFAKHKSKELGVSKLILGMINENNYLGLTKKLKNAHKHWTLEHFYDIISV